MKEKTYIASFGAIPSPTDIRDYRLTDVACAQEFPEEFELPMCAVKNQGAVGSCVAHSLSEVIEYHDARQNNGSQKMSTGFIYGNRKNSLYKGSGMVTRDALKAIMTYGDCINSLFSQNIEVPAAITKFEEHYEDLKDFALPNRISQFYRVSTINEIKSALVNDGPVVFVINWYDDIKLDKSYILTSSRKKATGAHCMVIYGWDKNGWKFQNSWGTGWGNKGRAILPYDFPISEAWGVVDNITDENQEDIKKPFNSCIGQIIAKVVNAIINLFKKK